MHHGKNRGKPNKRKLSKKCKLNETREKLKIFVEIGGICNMPHWLRGDGCPWL